MKGEGDWMTWRCVARCVARVLRAHLEHAAPHLVHHVEVMVDRGLERGHGSVLAKANRTRCDLACLLIDGSF